MQVLVLAAGFGSRIRAVSGDRPKPLMEIGGHSLLSWNLRLLNRFGFTEVWINLHYRADLVRQAALAAAPTGMKIRFSCEEDILGTAGAARHLLPHIKERLLVIYGDNLLNIDLDDLVAVHRQSECMATIALFDMTLNVHTGIAGGHVVLARGGHVVRFVEGGSGQSLADSRLVNAGVYVLERPVVATIAQTGVVDFGRDVFPKMLAHGNPIMGHVIGKDEYCLGLDTPELFAAAQELTRQRKVLFV